MSKSKSLYSGNVVEYTMRGYINLHHSELLKQCKQPVHFVRRQMDEVMNKGR